MTVQTPDRRCSALGLVALMAIASLGCSEEAAPEQDVSFAGTSQSYEPPPPIWTLADIEMDEAVRFPEHNVPNSESVARAIAAFASAMANGDSVFLGSMMSERDHHILDSMVRSGEWDDYVKQVEAVRVATVEEHGGGFRLGLAVQDARAAYLTGWEAVDSGGSWVFTALNVGNIVADQLSMLDGASLEPPPDEMQSAAPETTNVPDQPPPSSTGGGRGFGGTGG